MPGASCLSTTAKARAGRREPEIWTFLALRAYLDCLSFGESRYLPSIPLDWSRIAFHKRLGGFSRGTVAAPRPLMDAVDWAHPFAPVTLWLHGAPCFDWICWISAPLLFITSSYGRHGISCCARETPRKLGGMSCGLWGGGADAGQARYFTLLVTRSPILRVLHVSRERETRSPRERQNEINTENRDECH